MGMPGRHTPNGGAPVGCRKAPGLIGVLHLRQAPRFPYGELIEGFPRTESLTISVQRIQPGTEEKNRGAS